MDNLIWAILTIAFSFGAYVLSSYYQRRDNYIWAVFLLMIGGLILRVFTACDFFLHPWDEVFHAVVAKHMMQHPFAPTLYENPVLPYDYKNWAGNHIWLHKQPLPLWTMALSMSIFGVNEIALRLPSILLTTLGVYLTYYIGSYFFDRRTGYLAAFFYSVNGLIIEMTAGRVATDHVDVFFLFFIELGVFLSIVFARRQKSIYNIAVGISIGAAILCKWLPALIVLPIWLLIVLDSKKFSTKQIIGHLALLIFIIAAVSLPWQFYIRSVFPLEALTESSHNFRHITETLDSQGGPFYYYLDKIRINYGELLYIPLLWLMFITWRSRQIKMIALAIWIFVPILFFSFLKTKMQGYILFSAPPLFIITAAFFDLLHRYTWNQATRPVYRYSSYLLLILFIILPVRYAFERIKFFSWERQPQWVTVLKSQIGKGRHNVVLLNHPKAIAVMFYTDWTAYEGIPQTEVIQNLLRSGYVVVINDKVNVPADVRQVKGVEFLKLYEANN